MSPPKRLSSLQHAYALGRRHAKAQMRCELDAMARRLHAEVSELAEEMTRRLRAEIVQLTDEVRAARAVLERCRHQDAKTIHELEDRLATTAGELLRDRYLRNVEQALEERADPDLRLH